jgi:hypothetical protein
LASTKNAATAGSFLPIPLYGSFGGLRIAQIADTSNSIEFEVPHNLATGAVIQYKSGTLTLPGFTNNTNYYAILVNSTTIQLATTSDNASLGVVKTIASLGSLSDAKKFPKGLSLYPTYYVIKTGANSLKLALDEDSAYAGNYISILPATVGDTCSLVGEVTMPSLITTSTVQAIVQGVSKLKNGKGILSLGWKYTKSTSLASSQNIDGFIVYLYASSTDQAYEFGTDGANEKKFLVSYNNSFSSTGNGLIITDVDVSKFYTVGVAAYQIRSSFLANTGLFFNTYPSEFLRSRIFKDTGRVSFSLIEEMWLQYEPGILLADSNIAKSALFTFRNKKESVRYEITQGYQTPKYQLYLNGADGTLFITDWLNASNIRANYSSNANIDKIYFAAGASEYKYLVQKQSLSSNISFPTRQYVTYTYSTDGGSSGKK